MSKQDASTSQGASQEIIACKQRCRVLWIRERHIDKDTLHDNKHGGTIERNTDRGCNPVDISTSSPGENEETDCRAKACEEGRHQARLLGA